MVGNDGHSSPFAVLGNGYVVLIALIVHHHRLLLLLVGGIRHLQAVVAVVDQVCWRLTIQRGGRCLRLRMPFIVHGWLQWALLVTGLQAWVVGGQSFCSRLGVW